MRRLSANQLQKINRLLRKRARKLARRRMRIKQAICGKAARHRLDGNLNSVTARLFEKSAEGIERIALVPSRRRASNGRYYNFKSLIAPEIFCLNNNLDEVVSFIYELRRQVFINKRFGNGGGSKSNPGLYIDLDKIKYIDLESALLLAAELDRVRRVLRISAVMDDDRWDPFVRSFLHGVGLYNVIEARRLSSSSEMLDFEGAAAEQGFKVIPFISCTKADPAKALKLREELYKHCARPGDAEQMKVYEALVEAFNNAVGHAYRSDIEGDGLPRSGRWWAGAMIDMREGHLHIVVYDQGLGIPATLPKRPWWSIIAGKLPEKTDAHVIEGALEYGRSGVSKDALFGDEADGRGNGLWRMCELAETFEEADVRFTSLKGDVVYAKGGATELNTLTSRFPGTLIRWRTKLPALTGVAA